MKYFQSNVQAKSQMKRMRSMNTVRTARNTPAKIVPSVMPMKACPIQAPISIGFYVS
jgi:hypothetical protein